MTNGNHRTTDDLVGRPKTLEKIVQGPNGEFSPFRAAAALVGILLSVLGVVGWFWILSVSADQRLIGDRVNAIDTRQRVLETKYEGDLRYIREKLDEISAEMKDDRRRRDSQ